jgi:N utilization substance protein B
MTSRTAQPDHIPVNQTESEVNVDSESSEPQLTDKLDQIAGGRTISEEAPSVPRGTRGARAAALQALYEEDVTGHPPVRVLHQLPVCLRLSAINAKRAEAIVRFVSANRQALDKRIAGAAKQYPVQQMSTVDRNVLRIALAELDPEIGTPVGVAVNEAVEVARLFGSESSPGFVNGVLGALLR